LVHAEVIKNEDGSIHYVELSDQHPGGTTGYVFFAPSRAECLRVLAEMKQSGYAHDNNDLR
jgi:hypothetical protein